MRTSSRTAAVILTACAVLGMIDATYLVLQYLAALAHPGEATPCTVNTLVSCTKTVQGPWAHYFVIPNPLLGMLWYAGLTAYGATLALGTKFSKAARTFIGSMILLGLFFSYRLYLASVLQLAGVCPFCLFSTFASTMIALCFFVDDASYPDPVLGTKKRWTLTTFQVFSFASFSVGLTVFMAHGLSLLPAPKEAMMHWSFPAIVLIILASVAGHVWAYRNSRTI